MVFQEVYSDLQQKISTVKAKISCGALPIVSGNYSQLVQLLQHLLDNSLKYRSLKTPAIAILSKFQHGQWLFSIQDNGIGMDTQYGDRIFQIFQRLHTQQEYSGTGIGLAVCKKVVEYHGGRIWVESQPAVESTFYFTLNASAPSFQ